MPTFKYKAVDKTGRPARGSLDAANDVDLELRLKRMGLDLLTFRPVVDRFGLFARGNVTRQDLITFCFHLEQISRAGVPLMEGLKDLRDSMDNPRFREIVAALVEDVEGGKMLSQALAEHPRVFDEVFVNLVKAGEQTGLLEDVFSNLAATLKWQDELVAQTRRLLIYPLLVLAVVSAAIVFLMLFVVPQVVMLLKNMGAALPLQTRILIFLSQALAAWWPLLLGVLIIVPAALMVTVRRSARARYFADLAKLNLPVLGPILQKIILARFANFFALMYRSGITVLDAINACQDLAGNRVIADGLRRAGQQISAGDGLTDSFRNLGLFPPLVIRMLKVGETTGALDTALLNVSYFYSREVKESIEQALKLLEPALTVVLGAIMALIMFSVLMPVYDIIGKLKL
jgi:type IV pilus assembly protein PilC